MKFLSLLAVWASLFQLPAPRVMHIDVKFIRVRTSKDDFAYLFVALGEDHKIRALANARTKENAERLFERLREKQQIPEIAVRRTAARFMCIQ